MTDVHLPHRTLKMSAVLALLCIGASLAGGEPATAAGIAIGAGLGLLSLGSYIVIVPRLCRPDNDAASLWLGVLTLVKLPAYAIILGVAMSSPLVNHFAVFVGAGIVPLAIAGNALLAAAPAERRPDTRPSGQT